jgi:hypothetical protein
MPLGTIYKYNKNRKYSVIRPKTWGDTLRDLIFETAGTDFKVGDTVEYTAEIVNKRDFAKNIKKV